MYAYLVNLFVIIQIESYTIPVAGFFESGNSITKSRAIDFYRQDDVAGNFMSLYEV